MLSHGNMCEILAEWRQEMSNFGDISYTYKRNLDEYQQVVEPFITDDYIADILDEMKTYPECFPPQAIARELPKENKKDKSSQHSYEIDDWI